MKILAIDIGSSLIKCVLVETKFNRFEVVLNDIVSVSDALNAPIKMDPYLSPGQITALREIEQRHSKNADRIVTNLPFSLYSNRIMNFPMKDKRKILQAVNFAIEDEIPFNLDDCIISSHLYPNKTKDSFVLTGFAPIEPLAKFIEAIENIHLPIDSLVMEQAAFSSYFAKVKAPQRSIAVLNLGHQKSTISIYRDGGIPFLHRTTMLGGFHITQAIAKKYDISMPEAEIAKQDRAFLAEPGMNLDEDQRFFATMIETTLDPVFHDFDQTLMAFTSRTNEQVGAIYICGGSSLIPGITEHLSQRWNIPVQNFLAVSQLPNTTVHPQKNTELLLSTAVPLAISQVSGETKTSFNFRTGRLKSTRATHQFKWQQFNYPLKLAAIIYLFMLISFTAQTFLLKSQTSAQEKKLDVAIQSIFGKTSQSYLSSLKSSPQKLRQGIDKKVEELSSQLAGGGEAGNFSPLDILNSLSKGINATAIAEIKQMQLTNTSINLQLESPSQQDAETIIKQISSLPPLQNPKASPLENASGTRKKYSINSTIAVPKDGA